MNKLFVVCCFIAFGSFAQPTLVFTQASTHKKIEMHIGHRATILYKGYLGQLETAKETITDITDSTIVLGINYAETYPRMAARPGKNLRMTYKVIRVSDIVGFRRMTIGRQLGSLAFKTAGIVGSFYLLRNVYANPSISAGNAFLISLGTGFSILGINSLLFPENIKYYMEDGWSVAVQKR
jgi:hypothetical protein